MNAEYYVTQSPWNQENATRSPLGGYYLSPGQILFTRDPCDITTVLGPCVAVTFWDPVSGLAAMCHGMLPEAPDDWLAMEHEYPWKYVDLALLEMVSRLTREGVRKGDLQVKLFGGARLLPGGADVPDAAKIGERNVEMARRVLQAHALRIRAEDVLGCRGRKVILNTVSGAVRVKMLAD